MEVKHSIKLCKFFIKLNHFKKSEMFATQQNFPRIHISTPLTTLLRWSSILLTVERLSLRVPKGRPCLQSLICLLLILFGRPFIRNYVIYTRPIEKKMWSNFFFLIYLFFWPLTCFCSFLCNCHHTNPFLGSFWLILWMSLMFFCRLLLRHFAALFQHIGGKSRSIWQCIQKATIYSAGHPAWLE